MTTTDSYHSLTDEDVDEDDQLTDFSQKYSETSIEDDDFVVNNRKLVETDTLKSYYTEGTPLNALSAANSLNDLNNMDDNYSDKKLNNNDRIDGNRMMKPIPPTKPANLTNFTNRTDAKTVTFAEDNVIETPLMFSRSSSVESLSEVDIKINPPDDSGSVVSEFR